MEKIFYLSVKGVYKWALINIQDCSNNINLFKNDQSLNGMCDVGMATAFVASGNGQVQLTS